MRWLVVLGALLVALVVGSWLGRMRVTRAPDLGEHRAAISAAAQEFKLDPDLLRALVAVESGGDAHAVSRAGAIGLTQLMPPTAQEQAGRLGVRDYAEERLTEPVLNLRLGASYLARLLRRFDGSEPFALAAYNAGPQNVIRWREAAPDASPQGVIEREGFAETRKHVRRVLRYRAAYASR